VSRVVYFKECPKCGGDMQLQDDMYGAFKQCVQCGLILELESVRELGRRGRRVA
jgi:ssDNA-binding Zn-finger/Zn-ribbon topoisomerase 1